MIQAEAPGPATNRPRTRILLAAFVGTVVVLSIGVLLLGQAMKAPSRSGMFPDRLGDMTLSMYLDGPAAVGDVQALHGNAASVRVDNAYLARYSGAGADRARFWVSDSATAAAAAALLEAMRVKIGAAGPFSRPTALTVEGTTVYFVTGPPEIGRYNYFYARGGSVFWVQIDAADEARRVAILAEAVRRVTR